MTPTCVPAVGALAPLPLTLPANEHGVSIDASSRATGGPQVQRRVYAHGRQAQSSAGVTVKTVAAALDIHPFMLSKWRKDVRENLIRRRAPKALPPGPAREIAQFQALEKPTRCCKRSTDS
jgi:transposase-like protein